MKLAGLTTLLLCTLVRAADVASNPLALFVAKAKETDPNQCVLQCMVDTAQQMIQSDKGCVSECRKEVGPVQDPTSLIAMAKCLYSGCGPEFLGSFKQCVQDKCAVDELEKNKPSSSEEEKLAYERLVEKIVKKLESSSNLADPTSEINV